MNPLHPLLVLAALILGGTSVPCQIGVTPSIQISVPLPGVGFDLARDDARGRVYVSMPDLDEIAVVDIRAQSVLARIPASPRPHGIDVSIDGSTLFVALYGAAEIACIDLTSLQEIERLPCGLGLGDLRTWDVVEAQPDWLLASASPGGQFARIALIRRDQNNVVTTVADRRIIRGDPTFLRDPTGRFAYVAEGGSPNSLYKLDLSSPTVPIVLEDQHGSMQGTLNASISADGARIFLASSQIVDAATFQVAPLLNPSGGVSRPNTDASRLWVLEQAQDLKVFDTASGQQVAQHFLPCATGNYTDFELSPDETLAVVLVANQLCGVSTDRAPLLQAVEPMRTRHDAGPRNVTLRGALFDLGTNPTVTFGGRPATNVNVIDARTMTCTAPAGDPGPATVRISNSAGYHALTDAFFYTPAATAVGEHVPGGSVDLRFLVSPGDSVFTYTSALPLISASAPGVSGTLCLGAPAPWFASPALPLDEFTLRTTVPNDPILIGFDIAVQALATGGLGNAALTNCVVISIR